MSVCGNYNMLQNINSLHVRYSLLYNKMAPVNQKQYYIILILIHFTEAKTN